MVSCNSNSLSSAAIAAADFINSELWSSAVTVEMNGKGSVTAAGRWDVWMDGGEGRDDITVLGRCKAGVETRSEGRSLRSTKK